MIVMPANNAKMEVGYLAGKYPGRVGWLLGPGGWKQPKEWLPYAMDNGRFSVAKGKQWDEAAFLANCEKAANTHAPLWLVVPDVVGDRDSTLRDWDLWAPRLEQYGWPLAMAVQDGMKVSDVPGNASVVFVGGTTEWKRRTLRQWCADFPRVHIGRINTERLLWVCHEAGAESCDGTGWFRGDENQTRGLYRYLERASRGERPPQRRLFEEDCGGCDSRSEVGSSLRSSDTDDARQGKVA